MILHNGIFTSTLFVDCPVVHGFTTRALGNLGYGKNPGDPDVKANRKQLFDSLHLEKRRHVQPRQIHSGKCIDSRDFVPGIEADAAVSRSSVDLLSVLTADCVPILLYHPDGIVGTVHAGWRGLSAGIISESMKCFPDGTVAAIGPAIGACCYEVNPDLAQDFARKFGSEVVSPGVKPHLDLVEATIVELQKAGVERIDACRFCTRCHADLFFSYRRDGSSGRMMSFIGLS